MNPFFPFFTATKLAFATALVAVVALFFASPARATESGSRSPDKSKPGTLQVQVSIPPPVRIILEQDVQDLIYTQISDTFKQRGYKGDIEEVKLYEDPSPGCWLVKIDVSELRRDPIGNIVCTFGATLQDGKVTRNLGTFRGSALPGVVMPGPSGPQYPAEAATASALSQLYDAIAKTELVPGIREKA